MQVQNMDREWKFGRGMEDPLADFFGRDQDVTINLPHDYMIENDVCEDAPAGAASGFYNAGVAHYKKMFFVPENWEGEHIYLRFDGVMMNATVEVNGGKVALHHYGYTPFCVEITKYVYCGKENKLSVLVNPSMQPNSRWYTGAGIFRSVELLHGPDLHIENDGIYGYTKEILYDEDGKPETAFLHTEVRVKNLTEQDHMAVVEMALEEEESGEIVLRRTVKIQVDANTTETAYLEMTVDCPKVWDLDNPQLYRLRAKVKDLGIYKTHFVEKENGTEDADEVLFGIRTISADVKRGLRINGKSVKLRGGCVHHDNGLLGAVSLYDAEVRRIKKMKEVGFNAVRTTHNPPSKILLEVCDRLGMYVYAEAFDAWRIAKQPGDYNQYFEKNWEEDLAAFMRRDRNHPSIILWSVGNEIPERGGLGNGYTLATKVVEQAKILDRSRPVSNAICSYWSGLDIFLNAENMKKMAEHMQEGSASFQNADGGAADTSWEEMSEAFMNGLDVVGYNYMEDKYLLDHEMYPERVILGSENYPKEIGKRWPMVERLPYVLGDFTWTAVDYIGEAGIGKSVFLDPDDPKLKMGALALMSAGSQYPYRLANDADIDINGNILPQGNYRSVVFGSDQTYVFSYNPKTYGKQELLSNWGFPGCQKNWNWAGSEGEPVKVLVFSRADEVELLLNGEVIGRKKQGESLGIEEMPLTFLFELSYKPGTLTAVGYTDGKEVSRDQMETTGEATEICIKTDRNEMAADGHGLIYAEIQIVDEKGRPVNDAENGLTASCEGAAELVGFGSGNPITEDNYTKGVCKAYRGKACAILRSGYEEGQATLTIRGDGVREKTVTVRIS